MSFGCFYLIAFHFTILISPKFFFRAITGIDNCEQYPELIAVSYDQNPESPLDPAGVVQVWNNRFKKTTAEFDIFLANHQTKNCQIIKNMGK